MKYFLVLILGIGIGFFIKQGPPPVETKLAPEDHSKFQNFIDTEVRNFAHEKDADAKLKAAEELYGKMMVLFLANLSLKSTHQFVPAEKIVKAPEKEKEKVEVAKVEPIQPPIEKIAPQILTPDPEVKKGKKGPKTPQEIYYDFRSAHYLESFKAKQKRVLGHFTGILKRVKPKPAEDVVRFEFNLVQQGNNLSGGTLVTMTDPDGNEYSRNAGNGGNRALKAVAGEPDSYYVDASPTSFFIISLKKFPEVKGAYYEKGEHIGDVELTKVSGDL